MTHECYFWNLQPCSLYFGICRYFSKCFFRSKWNGKWLLLIKMGNTSWLVSCQTTPERALKPYLLCHILSRVTAKWQQPLLLDTLLLAELTKKLCSNVEPISLLSWILIVVVWVIWESLSFNFLPLVTTFLVLVSVRGQFPSCFSTDLLISDGSENAMLVSVVFSNSDCHVFWSLAFLF